MTSWWLGIRSVRNWTPAFALSPPSSLTLRRSSKSLNSRVVHKNSLRSILAVSVPATIAPDSIRKSARLPSSR